jgi:hypothetical protein
MRAVLPAGSHTVLTIIGRSNTTSERTDTPHLDHRQDDKGCIAGLTASCCPGGRRELLAVVVNPDVGSRDSQARIHCFLEASHPAPFCRILLL